MIKSWMSGLPIDRKMFLMLFSTISIVITLSFLIQTGAFYYTSIQQHTTKHEQSIISQFKFNDNGHIDNYPNINFTELFPEIIHIGIIYQGSWLKTYPTSLKLQSANQLQNSSRWPIKDATYELNDDYSIYIKSNSLKTSNFFSASLFSSIITIGIAFLAVLSPLEIVQKWCYGHVAFCICF